MIFRIILNWISCPLHIARDSADPRSNALCCYLPTSLVEATLDQGSVIATVPILILSQVYTVVHWSQIQQSRMISHGPYSGTMLP